MNNLTESPEDYPLEQPEEYPVELAENAKMKLRVREINKAARQIGCVTLRASRIAAMGNIGKFVEETGAVPMGLGILMMTGEALDKALKKCDDWLQQVSDPEVAVQLLQVMKELAGKRIDMALAFTKIKESPRQNHSMAASAQLPPDAIVIGGDRPMQINVLPNQDTSNS